jgi:tungstate transport system substrate-binding protein
MTEWTRSLAAGFLAVLAASAAVAQEPFIIVASTTSTEESGLFGYLLPAFTKETGIQVRVVAVGTGQALKIGERGDCDVVFVHDTPSELAFVEHGFGIDRREVMYSDFILVGPKTDPAVVDGGKDIVVGFRKIAEAKAPFVARGDDRAPARPRCACGRKPVSTQRRRAEAGIAIPARGWVQRSTRLLRWTAIRCPIEEHG